MERAETNITPGTVYKIAAVVVTLYITNFIFGMVSPQSLRSGNSIVYMIFAGGVVVTLISILNFELALIIFIFAAPVVAYHVPGLNYFMTPSDAFLVIIAVVYFLRMSTGRERGFSSTILDKPIFYFILLSILSMINTNVFSEGAMELIQTFEYFVICYYIFSLSVNRRNVLETLFMAIMIVGFLVSVHGIVQYWTMGRGDTRITGTFAHFNAMGTFMAMATTFTFARATTEKDPRRRIFFFMILFLNILALLLSFSRGAWIGTVVGIVIIAWIRGMVNFLKYFSVIFVFLILLSLFVPSTRYTERFRSISNISDVSSQSRLNQYEIVYDTIITYPLLGVGLANNKHYVRKKYNAPESSEIHNLFFHIAIERGVPAAFTLLLMFMIFYWDIIKRIGRTKDEYYKSIYLALMAVMIAFGMTNMFAYMLIRGPALFFAMFLGLYQATIYVEENEPKSVEWARLLSSVDLKRPTMRMGL
ncbi:O-antigen ligase family protein [bacterium]